MGGDGGRGNIAGWGVRDDRGGELGSVQVVQADSAAMVAVTSSDATKPALGWGLLAVTCSRGEGERGEQSINLDGQAGRLSGRWAGHHIFINELLMRIKSGMLFPMMNMEG